MHEINEITRLQSHRKKISSKMTAKKTALIFHPVALSEVLGHQISTPSAMADISKDQRPSRAGLKWPTAI